MKRPVVWLTVIAIALSAGVGCKREKKSSPKYWVKRLNGNNWEEAVHNLERMMSQAGEKGQEAKEAALQPLMDLYDRNPNPIVMSTLVAIKDKRVVPVLVKAVEKVSDTSQMSIDSAAFAAEGLLAFGATQAPSAEGPLIKLATSPTPIQAKINKARDSAVRALASFPSEASTDALAGLLADEPDVTNILLQGDACLSIADHPDATRALPQLLRGLFLAHKLDPVGTYPYCRLALARVGDKAVDALIDLLNEKYEPINKMATTQAWKPPAAESGIIILKAAGMLADLRAKRAADALHGQLMKESAKAGNARDPVYLELFRALSMVIEPAKAGDLLKEATAGKEDLEHLRAPSINFYSLIGARAGRDAFLKLAAAKEWVPNVRGAAAIAAGRLAQSAEDQAAIEAVSAKLGKDDPIKPVVNEGATRAKVAVECGAKPECYAGKLKDPNLAVVEKAILELGWMGEKAKSVLPQILEACANESSTVRGPSLVTLTRVAPGACPECVDALQKTIKSQENSTALRGVTDETKVVLNWYLGKSTGSAPAAPPPQPAP